MLDFHLYANRLFRSTLTVVTLMSISFFGVVYMVALFYQDGLGYSAFTSGLNVFPQAVGIFVGGQVVTRVLYRRFGPRRIMVTGALLTGSMMIVLSTFGSDTNLWTIRPVAFLMGVGMSGIFLPSQAASFATVRPAQIARGTTLFQSQQRLGAALGVAGITTVAAAVGFTHVVNGRVEPNLRAYHVAFLSAAVVMLITAASALLVSDADAIETMTRVRPRDVPTPARADVPGEVEGAMSPQRQGAARSVLHEEV
jgi:MFS family permease